MVGSENKYTYWVFTLSELSTTEELVEGPKVAAALRRLSALYFFQKEKATRLHYQGCFKTRIRKRQQTVLNEMVAELDVPRAMLTISPMMGTWEQAKAYCSKEETAVGEVYTNEILYEGKDIEVLDERSSRFPWQEKIINFIIEENTHSIKATDDRTIVWIEDTQGGNGKSKLVKWCCVRFDDICKISFGTSNQLRSAIIAAGPKKVYFIDVPRTLGSDDSIASLMSALEDLKNGFVVSAMYGTNAELVLNPPHIIVFSNLKCPTQLMSVDRWLQLSINYKKDLVVRRGEAYTIWELPT